MDFDNPLDSLTYDEKLLSEKMGYFATYPGKVGNVPPAPLTVKDKIGQKLSIKKNVEDQVMQQINSEIARDLYSNVHNSPSLPQDLQLFGSTYDRLGFQPKPSRHDTQGRPGKESFSTGGSANDNASPLKQVSGGSSNVIDGLGDLQIFKLLLIVLVVLVIVQEIKISAIETRLQAMMFAKPTTATTASTTTS